jgi:tRNA1(Val) A37 N6-methylase TrmN6
MLDALQQERNKSFFLSNLDKIKGTEHTEDNLLFVSVLNEPNRILKPSVFFSLEKATEFGADAVYFKLFENQSPIPQIYIYDFTGKAFHDSEVVSIQKKVWSSSIVPLVYIFTKTEIKIIDCTKPAIIKKDSEKPNYLEEHLSLVNIVQAKLAKYTLEKIGTGLFWDTWNNPNKAFSFSTSAYSKLLNHLKVIKEEFIDTSGMTENVAQKLIIQAILIKYLEERVGADGSVVFPQKYFNKYQNANSFCDVLRNGQVLELFTDLNKNKFNGKIFEWSDSQEIEELKSTDLKKLANFLDGTVEITGQINLWRLYSFSHLPVELISRLYEEFLGQNKEGLVYTPPHLANFLINEAMPLDTLPKDISDFKVLDPSCGSGIFLVTAFKRLVQWYRIKNGYKTQLDLDILKAILRNNIFGVDIEGKAVQLAAFSLSLAICDMITPSQIWQKLKFDDLRKDNLVADDFFNWMNITNKQFDLIIGNPPFSRGKIEFDDIWQVDETTNFQIPQSQISLKFLCESMKLLKPKGLQCLIMHSPSLLYNGSSIEFRKVFFQKFNVLQIIDFTSLARNFVLWDSAEPATAAIFTRNENPQKNNILHLTIRRSKAATNRIYFEIDDYDMHFVSKHDAINNPFIWKINLLGGGRLKAMISRFSQYDNLEKYLKRNKDKYNFNWGEGQTSGTPILPTKALNEGGLDHTRILSTDKGFKDKPYYHAPSLLLKENIGEFSLTTYLNKKDYISFRNEIMAISVNKKFSNKITEIAENFEKNNDLYRFYIYCTSGRVLVSKNTSILKEDLMHLPYHTKGFKLSSIEKNVIKDVLVYYQNFIRYGERSKIFNRVEDDSFFKDYCKELEKSLLLYGKPDNKSYKVVEFKCHSEVATCKLEYTANSSKVFISHSESETLDVDKLINHKVNESLMSKRIIKIYHKNYIYIIKPNQVRYWMKSIAYRDADKIFNEMIK